MTPVASGVVFVTIAGVLPLAIDYPTVVNATSGILSREMLVLILIAKCVVGVSQAMIFVRMAYPNATEALPGLGAAIASFSLVVIIGGG